MIRFLYAAIISILIICGPVHAQDGKPGIVSGQVMGRGAAPLAGAMVFFYNVRTGPAPSYTRYWRVPDLVMDADDQGKFSMEIPEGTYCIGAIKRAGKRQLGPPCEGDLFLLSLDGKGAPKKFDVKPGEKIDIGNLGEAVPYKSADLREGMTAIEGSVLDREGKPVESAIVFAFVTPSIVGKPLFVSERSSKDGKYLLRVHEGGNFYLKVRSSYGGGPPASHEIVDSYAQDPAALLHVTLKTGEIAKGVNLRGIEFPGRGARSSEIQPFVNKGGELKR